MTFTVNASLLDAIVLSVVSTEDTYGYKITQEVNKIIGVSESTLYPVLRRLQKDNNLEVYDMEYLGRNRRYYKITNKGRILLNLYQEEWTLYKEKIDRVFAKNFESFGEDKITGENNPKDKNKEKRESTANSDKQEKKPKSKITAEETIDTIAKFGHKIGETIDNLKIPEKIENLKIGEKFDSLKIPEKLEHLKITEKLENFGNKVEKKFEEIGEKVEKKVENFADEIEKKAENIEEKAENFAENFEKDFENLADKVENTVEDLSDKAEKFFDEDNSDK